MARTIASGKYLTQTRSLAYPHTFACWARPTTLALASLVGLNNGSSQYASLCLNASGGATAIRNAGGGTGQVDIGTGATGVWQHYAATWTAGASAQAYYNATKSAAGTLSQPAGGSLQVGHIWNGSALIYAGDIGEVALWNIALSAADIAQLATGVMANTVQAGSLLGYWRIAGTASPEPDEMGGTALTLVGAPPQAGTNPPIIVGGGTKGAMFAVF